MNSLPCLLFRFFLFPFKCPGEKERENLRAKVSFDLALAILFVLRAVKLLFFSPTFSFQARIALPRNNFSLSPPLFSLEDYSKGFLFETKREKQCEFVSRVNFAFVKVDSQE